MKLSLCYCILSSFLIHSNARPSYVALIPNGNGVIGIAALGHENSAGGGMTNPFGKAFQAADHEWTTELCQADSDGDGATNGQELGDPCCTWTPSANFDDSASWAKPTHPGVFNSFSKEELAAMGCSGEADLSGTSLSGASTSMSSSSSTFGSQSSSSNDGSFNMMTPKIKPRFSHGSKVNEVSPTPAVSQAENLKTSIVAIYCFSAFVLIAM